MLSYLQYFASEIVLLFLLFSSIKESIVTLKLTQIELCYSTLHQKCLKNCFVFKHFK